MDIRLAEHGTRDYWEAVKLRDQVLRQPLGLAFTDNELAAEADQLHFLGYMDRKAVACAVLQWVTPVVAKMRQVAVRRDFQNQGLGRRLVESFEDEALRRGFHEIVLHAREVAVPFYLRLGYEVVGDPFEEIGLPHQRMRKLLAVSVGHD